MFHLIPAPLHRAGLRLGHAGRKVWWRLRKPRLAGCRVLAFDGDGRILLIRHSYGSGLWMPPGGGLSRGEAPVAAAMRELLEETGCRLGDAFELARTVEQLHGAGNQVHVVVGQTADQPRPDMREVIEAQFFAIDAMPLDMPEQLRAELPGWIRAARAGRPRDAAEVPDCPPVPKA